MRAITRSKGMNMKVLENGTNLTDQQICEALCRIPNNPNTPKWVLDQTMDESERVYELADRLPGSVGLHIVVEEMQRMTVKWVHLLDPDEDWYDEEGVPNFRYLVLEVPREAPLFSWAAAAVEILLALDPNAEVTTGM